MARVKIDYGIDLGTTNSALCKMEKGNPKVIKSDTLKDTLPSCVSINRKGIIRVGDQAFNAMRRDKVITTKTWEQGQSNTYLEFKRTMGTDKQYVCQNLGRSLSSVELSAEVLKKLKSFEIDENITSVVITVPAKFTVNQKTATIEAAKLAGFTHCELLQEPVAASLAYGLSSDNKNGLWLVFDFGGGTFDAALMKVEDGIIIPFDTEGDNYLGGKNLDYTIVDEIIIPYLQDNYCIDDILDNAVKKDILREAMKTYAEAVKNDLSFKKDSIITTDLGDLGSDDDGEEFELDLTITQEDAFAVMRPCFQKAVDICKDLLRRNHLTGTQLDKLILVGGPTHCPLIRQMLREQISPNVDTSIDPMTAVAVGAALYASTIDANVNADDIAVGTVKLDLGYESTTVETTTYVTVNMAQGTTLPKIFVELERSGWSSGRIPIAAHSDGDVVEVSLQEGRPNAFTVTVYDSQGNRLPCFPNEITIIQGTKVGAVTLPYNIGIGLWNEERQRGEFHMAKGLEKNKPLPATGTVNSCHTTQALRPGVSADLLTIPVLQVDNTKEAEGSPIDLFEYVADVSITGDEIETPVPIDSQVDITLKVDLSEMMRIEVYFPATDQTIDKKLDTSKKQRLNDVPKQTAQLLEQAKKSIRRLSRENIECGSLQQLLDEVLKERENNNEPKMVLQHLKEVVRKIEDADKGSEWQRLEQKLRGYFSDLERAQADNGDEKTAKMVDELRSQVDNVIRRKDTKSGKEVLSRVDNLFYQLTMLEQFKYVITYYDNHFATVRWQDTSRARQLLNRGLEIITDQPTIDKLRPIVNAIFDLMPDTEAANARGMLK